MELKKKAPRVQLSDTSYEDIIQEMLKDAGSLKTTDLFFAMAKNFVCVLGADGFLKKVSNSFIAASGYCSEDLLAAAFADFVVRQERTDERSFYFETHFCCRSNRILKIRWRVIPELGGDDLMLIGWEM